jgi:hypothetical protein
MSPRDYLVSDYSEITKFKRLMQGKGVEKTKYVEIYYAYIYIHKSTCKIKFLRTVSLWRQVLEVWYEVGTTSEMIHDAMYLVRNI